MKKIIFMLACFSAYGIQALEFEKQFENDQISVITVKLDAHEEIGLHRHAYPQVAIALKGGTITRLETDGRLTDVKFPTGVAVFHEADPENELHKSVNNTSEAIELIVVLLKNHAPPSKIGDIQSHQIAIEILLDCPMSSELKDFVRSIPPKGNYSSSLENWKYSFINSMNHLIRLVESEKMHNSFWSVKAAEELKHLNAD